MKKALAIIAIIGLAATAAALPSQANENAHAQVDTPEQEEPENASQEEESPEPSNERRGLPSSRT